jgi:hypothetical protein
VPTPLIGRHSTLFGGDEIIASKGEDGVVRHLAADIDPAGRNRRY